MITWFMSHFHQTVCMLFRKTAAHDAMLFSLYRSFHVLSDHIVSPLSLSVYPLPDLSSQPAPFTPPLLLYVYLQHWAALHHGCSWGHAKTQFGPCPALHWKVMVFTELSYDQLFADSLWHTDGAEHRMLLSKSNDTRSVTVWRNICH